MPGLGNLTSNDVLRISFRLHCGLVSNLREQEDWQARHITAFKKQFGVSPAVYATIWEDLKRFSVEMMESDDSEQGFRSFLVAIRFLWAYPRNGMMLASVFRLSDRMVQGERLWRWVTMIASLTATKIVWPHEYYNDPNGPRFIVSVDGTDFRVREPPHPTLPYDKRYYSHKFHHGAVKYEIAIDVYRRKVVRISWPHRAGMHDKFVYVDHGLRDLVPQGKRIICDRVYESKAEPDDHLKLALPSPTDSHELAIFKARVRARHEGFNGRLKDFQVLSDTFRHGIQKHKHAFEAVCVILQYDIDGGSPVLFDP